jgi:hypothetical protein
MMVVVLGAELNKVSVLGLRTFINVTALQVAVNARGRSFEISIGIEAEELI